VEPRGCFPGLCQAPRGLPQGLRHTIPRFHSGPAPLGPTGLNKDFHVFISEAFAQAAPAAAAAESPLGGITGMLPIILMFVVLYFVMIRPQMKRQKEHKAMIDALAKGDEVVVAGGMLGKVSKMGETFLHVEIANNVEIQVQRSAVVQVLPKGTIK
jgi:preprotein translocase subunit YajC